MSIVRATTPISEELERIPVGKFHRRVLVLLGSGMVIDAFDIFLQSAVLASMVAIGFATAGGEANFLFATFLGLAVGSVLSGALTDVFGRRFMYQINLLIFGIAAIVAAFVPTLTWVITLRFIMGIGLGGEVVTGYAALTEFIPANSRGRWAMWLGFITNLGQPLAAFVGLLVLPTLGWRWMFIIGGVPALIVWYFRRRLPESPRWLERRGRTDEAQAVVQSIVHENGSVQGVGSASIAKRTTSTVVLPHLSWTVLFAPRLIRRTIFGFLITGLILAAQYGFLTWVPTLLLKSGVSIIHSLAYSALMAIGAPVGMLIAVFTLDRLGRRWMIMGSAFLSTVFGVAYAFALHAPAVVIVLLGFVLVLLMQICANVIVAAYLPEIFPTDVRGTGAGASVAFGRVAAALMPFLVVAVLTGAGPQAVFLLVAGMLLILVILVAVLGEETRKRTLEDISKVAYKQETAVPVADASSAG
ncbi:MAG: MFS transporter [Ktedonobacteraceae bacterium]